MQDILDNLKNAFASLSYWDIIDILLIAIVIYFAFKFLKHNHAIRLAKYLVVFVCLGIIVTSKLLDSRITLVSSLFANFVIIAIVIIVIIFASELKRVLWRIGSPKKLAGTFNQEYNCTDEQLKSAITEIVKASQSMAKKNIGALILVVSGAMPSQIIDSGTLVDGVVSSELIESVFVTKGPVHDGALVIRGNRVVAVGCFLPLTQRHDIPKELGTRHRAGICITENNLNLSIICSEETGVISACKDGRMKQYCDGATLTDALEQAFGLKGNDTKLSD